MSLSPIFSIMKDFLAVVSEAESDFAGSKLSDMCKDLGGTFSVSSMEGFLLLGKDEVLPFFTEDRGAGVAIEVDIDFDALGVEVDIGFDTLGVEVDIGFDTLGVKVDTGFDTLGVDFCGVLVICGIDFFLTFATFLSLLTPVVTYKTEKCKRYKTSDFNQTSSEIMRYRTRYLRISFPKWIKK